MEFTLNHALSTDVIDKDLVFEFFWKFSLFECALKREGYLKKKSDGSPAEANWICFGRSVADRFEAIHDTDFLEGVAELRKLSPRKQIVQGGELDWKKQEKQPNESDAEFVVRLLTTVRNNLFHGGKYRHADEPEIAKDRDILQAALTVLNGLKEIDPGVSDWMGAAP